jgi:hypothetical protein
MIATFAANVLAQADACGTISFTFAHAIADLHCLTSSFLEEYASFRHNDRVDAGEFLVWLGY